MKHKNKDGISLNYTSDDIHTRLVKAVILEAISRLEGLDKFLPTIEIPTYNTTEIIDFLKENFDIVEVEDFIGDKKNV